MAFCKIGGVGGELVCDHAFLNVLFVRQAKMFFWRDVAKHRRAEPSDHRGTDAARDVVIARCDVGRQRPERVERRLAANLKLLVHVLFDQVHRHMARALDHRLAIHFPCDLCQLAKRVELGKLRFVIRVGDRSRPQSIAKREGHIVGPHDLADLSKPCV